MRDKVEPVGLEASEALDPGPAEAGLSPLAGEPGVVPSVAVPHRTGLTVKRSLAVGLLVASAITACVIAIHRGIAGRSAPDAGETPAGRNRPLAASAEPRSLDMAQPPASPASAVHDPQVPAIATMEESEAEPIGVRRSGTDSPAATRQPAPRPEDAPVLLVTTRPGQGSSPHPSSASTEDTLRPERAPPVDAPASDPMAATTRNLQAYQQQLAGLLDRLTQSSAIVGPPGVDAMPVRPTSATATSGRGAPADGLDRGTVTAPASRTLTASLLGNRSLTLAKGTAFTCALKTRVISATSGLVGCQVQRNVFSDDGRVLLIERGSHLDGEYRVTNVRPGSVRIPVLWTRIRTPHGVTVDVDSPATGKLGESGIDGYVDSRWTERIGAAMLLSLIDDSVKLVIESQSRDRQADTIVLPSTTANTSKLAEKVLDSTINIPPLIYQNHGGIVGIYVAHDIDFSGTYELLPTTGADAGGSR